MGLCNGTVSVRLTVSPSFRVSAHSPAAAACGGFAAVGQQGRKYQSIAAEPAAGAAAARGEGTARSSKCGWCHVYSVHLDWQIELKERHA